MVLFDSHAHYDDGRFDEDREELLSSLPSKNIGYVVNVGCDTMTNLQTIEIAEKYPFIYAAVGIHPGAAHRVGDEDFALVEKLLSHEKVRALGEIGLDYHYDDNAPKEVQQAVFRRQMDLARRYKVPVCIHDREAHGDCMEIVREYRDVRGVFHSYSGSLEMARELIDLGWMLSFTGVITFKNAKKFEPILANIPSDVIMIETDCPYLAPEPHRGHRNDSSLVLHTCEKLAEIRFIDVEEAAAITTANAKRFYGIAD